MWFLVTLLLNPLLRKLLPFLSPITYSQHGRARVLPYLSFGVSGVLHALLQRPNIEARSSVQDTARHDQTRPLCNKCCYFHFPTGNWLCGFSLARAFRVCEFVCVAEKVRRVLMSCAHVWVNLMLDRKNVCVYAYLI